MNELYIVNYQNIFNDNSIKSVDTIVHIQAMSIMGLQRNQKNQLKQSNLLASNSRSQINNSQEQSQYQIVIEFQLRRERQKTRILEERLHNKQIFIQQMKQYQDELTSAFQKCQEELIISKKTIEQYHLIERDYIQQINELKHLVIRLEDEITIRDKSINKRHYSQIKKQINGGSPPQERQARAKTFMHQDESERKEVVNRLEEEVIKQSKKITKFIKQFLVMNACFCEQNEGDLLKNKLKIAWKWIKQVVKQWSQLKYQKQLWVNSQDKNSNFIHVLAQSKKDREK